MPLPAPAEIHILLVDHQRLVRSGIRLLLEREAGLKVIGECGDLNEALPVADRAEADVILLGTGCDAEGTKSVADLVASNPRARVIVLADEADADAHRQALDLGAMGIVRKEDAPELLIKAIRKVHAGEFWFDRAFLASVLQERRPASGQQDPDEANVGRLTMREREVIRLLSEGLKNQQIADRLHVSEGTIRRHLSSIFSKLDVTSRLELVLYAYRHGLAEPPRGPVLTPRDHVR